MAKKHSSSLLSDFKEIFKKITRNRCKKYKISLSKWVIAEHETPVFFMLNVEMLTNFSGNSGKFK